jgi:hypothetical protein
LKDLTPDERYEKRIEESKEILDAFYLWLQEVKNQALPKSSFGTAIGYSLRQ